MEIRKSGEKKGRRNLAMMLHKVSDAVAGKIKVVASPKTYPSETVVKMFPFYQCKTLLFNSTIVCTYVITLISFCHKLQTMELCYKV